MIQQPQYDYFTSLKTLKEQYGELSHETRRDLMWHVVLNCPDARAAELYADIHGDRWADIYPEKEKKKVTTTDAISTFLETYGHATPQEDALLERLIMNPTPDYAAQLEARERAEGTVPQATAHAATDATSRGIDSFLAAHPQAPAPHAQTPTAPAPQPQSPQVPPAPQTPNTEKRQQKAPEGGSLSESLAKVYITQGKYQRAYEIISDLNLKNPEKSVYFADQLRFLAKAIEIQKAAQGAQR